MQIPELAKHPLHLSSQDRQVAGRVCLWNGSRPAYQDPSGYRGPG